MPFNRKFRKRRPSVKIASRVKTLEKKFAKAVEMKNIRSLTQEQLVSTSPGGLSGFMSISLGDANGFRTGNKATLMSTQYRLMLRQNEGASADAYNVCRVLIVESKDGSQSLTWGDVLYRTPAANVNIYTALNSPYQTDIELNKHYKVVYDSGPINMAFNAAKQTKAINITRRYGKSGKLLNFDPNGNTPNNFKQTVLWMSDSAATPHPVIAVDVNNRYLDA